MKDPKSSIYYCDACYYMLGVRVPIEESDDGLCQRCQARFTALNNVLRDLISILEARPLPEQNAPGSEKVH